LLVLDALTYAGNARNLEGLDRQPGFHFVHGDIGDLALVESLLRQHRIDTVVHFAAESHVDRSIADSATFIATNIVGTHTLLEAARRVWLHERCVPRHRFHQVSTDEVYGSRAHDEPPVDESAPYAPNSPYAASKAAADHLVRAWSHTYGLEVTTSNCSNNYGPRQFPEKLIPLAIVHALLGRPIPLYGDGGNLRDWLHVDDHCRGIELVLLKGQPGGVYHLGGGTTASNRELLRTLCGILDEQLDRDPALMAQFAGSARARGASSQSLIQHVPDRPGHDRCYLVDGGKARLELGFTPCITLERGLRDTVAWYLANSPWWAQSA
jgi:dTDP-glucose 4,6-dehydratase